MKRPLLSIKALVVVVLVGALFVLAFALTLNRAMLRELNHDEHQFIASGALLARHSLLPYRDYPYFHMPNLVFLYALVFKTNNFLLLGARFFSVVCANLTVIVLFFMAYGVLGQETRPIRLLLAGSSIFFLLANPLFDYTSGLAWNHDLPTLLLILALYCYLRGIKLKRVTRWLFASGLLAGLAVGSRITYVAALVVLGTALFFYPGMNTRKDRLYLVFSFTFGLLIGMLPIFFLFGLAPRGFIFGNLQYARYTDLFHQESLRDSVAIIGKLSAFMDNIASEPGNLLLILAVIFFVFSVEIMTFVQERKVQFETTLVLALVLSLTLSGFLPASFRYQYFYAPVPFAILACVYGIARFYSWFGRQKGVWFPVLFVQLVILANIFKLQDYSRLAAETVRILSERNFNNWVPIQVHVIGKKVKAGADPNLALTLSPLYALEGGVDIYPQLASGPFAWRIAAWVPEEQREQLNLLAEQNLDQLLAGQPPGAVIVGDEGELEAAFIDYARRNKFQQKKLYYQDLWLWVP